MGSLDMVPHEVTLGSTAQGCSLSVMQPQAHEVKRHEKITH